MKYTKKSNPREYRIWGAMKARCYAPCNSNVGHYQEWGIQVCDRWRYSFQSFMEDMGECPAGYSIDRIDNHGDYEPSNCRWASNDEQVRNRSLTRFYTHDGKTMCLKDWADYLGIDYNTLHHRMINGRNSFEDAIRPDFGKITKSNTSGIVGVSYHKNKHAWQAYGKVVNGKQIFLGTFKNKEDAIAARKKYEEELKESTPAKKAE